MPKGIYALAGEAGWNNQQLTKNCGLVPWLFHKLYGWRAVMVGVHQATDYSGLAFVPGLSMDFLPDGSMANACRYIEEHAAAMDVLVLHGAFPYYEEPVATYRRLRPDGRIYLELDPNIHYEDRLLWHEPPFLQMLRNCDVIGASGHSMQRYLSAKWPCVIEYLPNGFYDLSGLYRPLNERDWQDKEPLILTVGRIGTPQKNNVCLLEAFLEIYREFPDWRVVFIGNVTDDFRTACHQIVQQDPALSGRIVLTGAVQDKAELMTWYRRAKIFALTSTFEGGTPNVVAEALMHGCYMVTSDIEAADDVIDAGCCGQKFALAEEGALSAIFREILPQTELLRRGGEAAVAYAQRNFDFVKIVQRLHELLRIGGEH